MTVQGPMLRPVASPSSFRAPVRAAVALLVAVACESLPPPVTAEEAHGPHAWWGEATAENPSGPHAPWGEATAEDTRLWNSELHPQGRTTLREDLSGSPPLPPTHGAESRARTAELEQRIEAILAVTLPEVRRLKADLDTALEATRPPERLATTDPVLKEWHAAERVAYESSVEVYYAEAEKRLSLMRAEALATGRAQARELAPPASALDAGATGDPALDLSLVAFEEVLDGSVGLNELAVRRNQDLVRRIDLFETFSSFGRPEEVAMGGRLLLFVGGEEAAVNPRAVVVLRCDGGQDPAAYSFRQVMRHRVMRGPAIVRDLGWRKAPMPGGADKPRVETLANFLVAPRVEPTVDREAPGFDQLRDMRVVVDVQTGAVDAEGALVGGFDWRIEFNVSASGTVTWQLAGGKPAFNADCPELRATFGLPLARPPSPAAEEADEADEADAADDGMPETGTEAVGGPPADG